MLYKIYCSIYLLLPLCQRISVLHILGNFLICTCKQANASYKQFYYTILKLVFGKHCRTPRCLSTYTSLKLYCVKLFILYLTACLLVFFDIRSGDYLSPAGQRYREARFHLKNIPTSNKFNSLL